MVEREMVTMMVDTLPVFYYEKLVGYMPSSFADLVFAGERIEVGFLLYKLNLLATLCLYLKILLPLYLPLFSLSIQSLLPLLILFRIYFCTSQY